MRVLYALNDASGGASMSAYQLIQALPRDLIEPYVVCYPSGSHEDLQRFKELCFGVEQVYMPWCTLPWQEPPWLQGLIWAKRMGQSGFHLRPVWRIARLIRRWQIDVVHSNTSVQVDAALAARWAGIAHVWHVRELIGRPYFRFGFPRRWISRFLYSFSDQVVANSPASADRIRENDRNGKLLVLPNAVRADEFTTEEGRSHGRLLRRQWGVGDGNILVGMCGSVGALSKRHDWFIEMASKVHLRDPRVRFVICGRLPAPGGTGQKYYQGLMDQVVHAGLSEYLLFAGHIPDIPGMMHALDVLVHPSPSESFGRVVLEAMAAGKPVVTMDGGGLADVVRSGETGFLVPPEDMEGFVEPVLQLVQNEDLRHRFGERGRERACKNYSIEDLAQQIVRLYRQVIQVQQS